MARICHQMCSRRGGSRSGGILPPAMPSPDSASPSSSVDIPNPYGSFSVRYPNTRSGRGQAQLQGVGRRDVIVDTTNFPLPPHPAPYTTQFRFHSTLHRLVITATATITFSEENNPQEALLKNNGEQQRVAQRNRSTRDPSKQRLVEDVATLHGKELVGSQQVVEGRVEDTQTPGGRAGDTSGPYAAAGSSAGVQPASGIQSGTSAEEEEWYQYVCLIEEEPAPNNL